MKPNDKTNNTNENNMVKNPNYREAEQAWPRSWTRVYRKTTPAKRSERDFNPRLPNRRATTWPRCFHCLRSSILYRASHVHLYVRSCYSFQQRSTIRHLTDSIQQAPPLVFPGNLEHYPTEKHEIKSALPLNLSTCPGVSFSLIIK